MKRKYEVARFEPGRSAVNVRMLVHDVGASWSFEFKMPYDQLDHRALYEAAELESERLMRWEHRQRERLDDSLF